VFSTLGVCDAVIIYLTIIGPDTRLNQDIVNGAFLLLAAVANGYLFSGVIDDRNKDKAAAATQAIDQSAPTTTSVTVEQ
jgi:hypothetical protein